MRKKAAVILLAVLLIVSLAGNVFLFFKTKKAQTESPRTRELKLLNLSVSRIPTDSNLQPAKTALHFKELRGVIENRIASLPSNQKVGVYLQNAYTGAWLGLNERESFYPASLLKIPIAMAVLKKVEKGYLDLNQKVTILEADIDTAAGGFNEITVGMEKTINELLQTMVTFSDNTAKNALKRLLTAEEINMVFTHVGIENPYFQESSNPYVAPRQFSRLFKALYFSTYLDPELSEKLLELMTETRVESLISAGVPWEVQVAHKYGERPDQLHDCGIVYHPDNPYFICVMTKEIEIKQAKDLISQISKDIYEFISSRSLK